MKTIVNKITRNDLFIDFPTKKDKIAFLDIETTGLSPKVSSLYLIGFMYYDKNNNSWTLIQWFADNYHSEEEMLLAFLSELEKYSVLYHFNGQTFDIPYILNKCEKYNITISKHCKNILLDKSGIASIDLLKHIRKLRNILKLEKCSQKAIEKWLLISRDDIFSGKDLISLYSEYMQKKILDPKNSDSLKKTLLLHNHDDVEMMLEVSKLLNYEILFSLKTDYITSPISYVVDDISNYINIGFTVTYPFPKDIELSYETIGINKDTTRTTTLTCSGNHIQCKIPIYSGTLKFFYPDYKDYFYLPKEDYAIHKSVGNFVDKEHKKKATAATCYTKKTGNFIPCSTTYKKRKTVNETLFFTEHNANSSFILVDNKEISESLVFKYIKSFLTTQ